MGSVNVHYQTIKEIEELINAFEQGTLPSCQWNHHRHLTVALWYLIHYNQQTAIDLIRERIQRYNILMNIETAKNSGYHETMTLFWIYMVKQYLSNIQKNCDFLQLVNELIDRYANKNLPFPYYSQDLLMSWEARQAWIEPDLNPINICVQEIKNREKMCNVFAKTKY
ncbi:hypothetical protein [Nostoc sp. TCL26-01]|uniref:hypothetical protein n=1 Tax=Nostoc sp. TCL26-01 TaxID=2576904 RepID=UPI0015BC42C4|nr:hypothetical protein [Nostoc sp. TCL26-01]QLE58379.1 hypothetical protein FD725_24410 [Nostoc sp. TCL26-01]